MEDTGKNGKKEAGGAMTAGVGIVPFVEGLKQVDQSRGASRGSKHSKKEVVCKTREGASKVIKSGNGKSPKFAKADDFAVIMLQGVARTFEGIDSAGSVEINDVLT